MQAFDRPVEGLLRHEAAKAQAGDERNRLVMAVRNGGAQPSATPTASAREGRVQIVYPEIQGGRVIADVEVSGLGDYFVGERTRVYVDTGSRRTIIVPASYVYRRAGVNYVRLAGAEEVVVQPGEAREDGDVKSVEILAGLKDGDRLATP